MRAKKPVFETSDLGVNPCVNSLQILVYKVEFKNQYKFVENMYLPASKEVEKVPYTKLFCSSERRLLINALSPRSKELYLWLMFEITSGDDYIWINKQRYMSENSISAVNTYKEAVRELVRYAFLSPTIKTGVYWINPNFFFKGDRISKYPKNIVKE